VRRLIVVASVVVVAVVAGAIVAVVRSNGGGGKTIQTVAGDKITQNDLELTAEHFHEEADREGKPRAPGAHGNRRPIYPVWAKCNLLHSES
jgi:beta-lactam-binding protein with PASTA domain